MHLVCTLLREPENLKFKVFLSTLTFSRFFRFFQDFVQTGDNFSGFRVDGFHGDAKHSEKGVIDCSSSWVRGQGPSGHATTCLLLHQGFSQCTFFSVPQRGPLERDHETKKNKTLRKKLPCPHVVEKHFTTLKWRLLRWRLTPSKCKHQKMIQRVKALLGSVRGVPKIEGFQRGSLSGRA